MHSVKPSISLDARELKGKQQELESLQQELVDRELEWSTAKRELHLFEQQYQVRVGEKYRELDRLKASVLALASKVFPDDDRIKNQAQSAWESVNPAGDPGEGNKQSLEEPVEVPGPSEELKKLFHNAARHMHPDLTTDGQEQKRRHDFMARLNEAYRDSDEGRVRALMMEFEVHQPANEGESAGARLSQVLKKIGQVRHRLFQIESELNQLEQSDLYRLNIFYKQQLQTGADVLADMAREANEQIQAIRNRIRNLASDCAEL